jgi:hypothetical protein
MAAMPLDLLRAALVALMLGGVAVAQDGASDIAKAIERAGKASDKDKVELLQKAVELADQQPLTAQERGRLSEQFVKVVKDQRLSMEQLEKVLGAAKKQVARQVFYRRYLEEWHVTHPLPFRATWDCPKGLEPTLRAISAAQ